MRKKIVTLFSLLLMLVYLAVPVWAETRNGVYILDEKDYLSDFEYQFYHNQASTLSDQLNMDILYVQTYDTDLQSDAQSLNLGSRSDQIMLLDNDGTCDIALFGTACVLNQDHIDQLLNAYTVEPTYSDGIASYLAVAEQIVKDLNASGAFDKQMNIYPRVVDGANLLDTQQEVLLLQKLDQLSEDRQFDFVIVTVETLDGISAIAYADDFFDYNGYGMGTDRDGVLLLVSMEERELWISTSGFGMEAITDSRSDDILSEITPMLSEGDYAGAFSTFTDRCDNLVIKARNFGEDGSEKLASESFPVGSSLFVSMIIGVIAAGCVGAALKRQLKSVRPQNGAADYTKSTLPDLTVEQDIYLYSTMSKRPKPKSNSSSSGSSGHRSSSGRSHGGSGGRF